jgi:hypothetical protein
VKAGFGETRRSIPYFAKIIEDYPFSIPIIRSLRTAEKQESSSILIGKKTHRWLSEKAGKFFKKNQKRVDIK